MASVASCFFDLLLVVLKLLEIACLLLELAARTFLRRLTGRHDAEPFQTPSVASVTFNELCTKCQGVVDIISHPGWHKDIVHHEVLASLENSSDHFCGICAETLEYIQRQPIESMETLFPIRCESDTSSASWQTSFELTLTFHEVKDYSLRFTFEITNHEKNEQAEYRPSSSTLSPESWHLVDRWMNECTQNHGRCNATIPERWFPSRVLDIGSSEDDCVRLVSRGNIPPGQPYATLSHCWGNTPIWKLLTSNMEELCRDIKVQRLPKTFMDAISITRWLGLRYLWIDSLCIIQDSYGDWSKEADLMSLVYRYCFINIAATGSADTQGGCFWERDPRTVLPTELSIHWIGREECETKRYLVVSQSDVWARKITHEPLNRRAWVLQERILSPRVLHLGRKQLFWECRQFVGCETYQRGLPASIRGHTSIDIKRLQLGDETRDSRWPAKYVSQTPLGVSLVRRLSKVFIEIFRPTPIQEVTLHAAMKTSSVFQDWDAVVELYTELQITFPKDKLIALGGLASSVSSAEPGAPGEGYLAGLWQSSLPAYFLWRAVIGEQSLVLPTRLREYVAPSWSWASINGKISLASCQHNYNSNDYLAVLKSAYVSHMHDYRFGQMIYGHVKLLGPVASVLWTMHRRRSSSPELLTADIKRIFPQDADSQVSVSVPPDNDTGPEVYFDTATDYTPWLKEPTIKEDSFSDIFGLTSTVFRPTPTVLTLLPVVGVTKRSAHENASHWVSFEPCRRSRGDIRKSRHFLHCEIAGQANSQKYAMAIRYDHLISFATLRRDHIPNTMCS